MDFELKPVSTRQEIVELWPQIKPGFESVLTYATGDDNIEKVLFDLVAVNLILWIGTIDGKYCGFVTTKITEGIHHGKRVNILLFNHIYQEPWVELFLLYEKAVELIDDYAKKSGCKLIKTYTIRNVEKYMNKIGFRKSYTEYIKEVSA